MTVNDPQKPQDRQEDPSPRNASDKTLSEKVKDLEESKEAWASLCREIIATISLEENKTFFDLLPYGWNIAVSNWRERAKYIEAIEVRPLSPPAILSVPIPDDHNDTPDAELFCIDHLCPKNLTDYPDGSRYECPECERERGETLGLM